MHGHGHWQTLVRPYSVDLALDSVDFHGIHGTAKICGYAWALANPGPIRVDWDNGD